MIQAGEGIAKGNSLETSKGQKTNTVLILLRGVNHGLNDLLP